MSALPHVAILHWPEDAAVVAYLRTRGGPRLLLVAAEAEAPIGSGPDEDWIRLPAREDDVRARVEALQARASVGPRVSDGRLHIDGRWVPLSPIEEAMTSVLLERFGHIVDVPSLARCGRDGLLSNTAVRVHLTRLRKRIDTLGLVVRTVRGRGYVLERSV
jgi:two-component system, OmpR family, response regulator